MLNTLSLVSIYVFDLILQPLVRDQQKWLHRNLGWFYQVLWLFPVVGTSLYLNVRWKTHCHLISRMFLFFALANKHTIELLVYCCSESNVCSSAWSPKGPSVYIYRHTYCPSYFRVPSCYDMHLGGNCVYTRLYTRSRERSRSRLLLLGRCVRQFLAGLYREIHVLIAIFLDITVLSTYSMSISDKAWFVIVDILFAGSYG